MFTTLQDRRIMMQRLVDDSGINRTLILTKTGHDLKEAVWRVLMTVVFVNVRQWIFVISEYMITEDFLDRPQVGLAMTKILVNLVELTEHVRVESKFDIAIQYGPSRLHEETMNTRVKDCQKLYLLSNKALYIPVWSQNNAKER